MPILPASSDRTRLPAHEASAGPTGPDPASARTLEQAAVPALATDATPPSLHDSRFSRQRVSPAGGAVIIDGSGSPVPMAPDAVASTPSSSSSGHQRPRTRPNGLDILAVRCLRTKPEDREMTKRADQARRHTWVWRSLVAKNEAPGVVPGPLVSGPRADGLQPFWIRDFEERYLLANRAESDAAEERRAEKAQE
ncbi:MAG: hypothetical protein IPK13_04750 [Deltaproteobacteria bacterium]|nr:hypothetical protein [Deltaproteobacteria bacterium]